MEKDLELNQQQLSLLSRELGLRKKPIPLPPSYEEMLSLARQYPNPLDKQLFVGLYLSGQRITEALNTRRKDVRMRTIEGKDFMVIDSITLKNRNQPRREIPIPMFGLEKQMSEAFWRSIENMHPSLRLYNFTRQRAFNHLSAVSIPNCRFIDPRTKPVSRFEGRLSIYPHFLRHARATHLPEEYEEYNNHLKLMNFFGWASPSMPNLYVSTSWRNLAGGFIK